MSALRRLLARSADGFTLIEILVAFAIAALVLSALYQTFSTGLRSSIGTDNYVNAVLIAESGLDALSATAIAVGETSERVGGYQRQTSVRPRPDLMPAQEDAPTALMLYEIEVRVAWRDGVRERALSLSTLRVGPRETSQ
jgi:general secretion pathway protein I